jgi:polysaccharide chain length determinant protein (PEP-CTERM system associated)
MLTDRGSIRASDFTDEELENPRSGLPALSVIRMMWKRGFQILLATAVLSAVALAVVYFWPPTYRAETLILVDSQKIPEKFVSATVSAELQDRLATISQTILSNTRLKKIIQNFKLYEKESKTHVEEEILEMMRSDIKITPEKGFIQNRPGAFRVSYEGQNPSLVAEVTNQLGNLFIEENLRAREVQAEGTSDFMKTQLQQAKKGLDEQEAKVSRFKQTYSGELPQQESALAQEMSRLQVQLQGNQDALNRAQQNKISLESALNVAQATEANLKRLIETVKNWNANKSPLSSAVQPAPKKKSEELEEQLANLRVVYRPEHPDVRNLERLLADVKAREKDQPTPTEAAKEANGHKSEEAPDSPETVRALSNERERLANLRANLAIVNRELQVRQEDNQKILDRIGTAQARIQRVPLREQEMMSVTRDYEISKANYQSLLNKIFAADMATDMERNQKSERFTILDPARVPEKPVSPNRPLLGTGGCLLAVALSVAFFLLLEIRKNRLIGEWELPEGVAVLGRVPIISLGRQTRPGGFWRKKVVAASAVLVVAAVSAGAYALMAGH